MGQLCCALASWPSYCLHVHCSSVIALHVQLCIEPWLVIRPWDLHARPRSHTGGSSPPDLCVIDQPLNASCTLLQKISKWLTRPSVSKDPKKTTRACPSRHTHTHAWVGSERSGDSALAFWVGNSIGKYPTFRARIAKC